MKFKYLKPTLKGLAFLGFLVLVYIYIGWQFLAIVLLMALLCYR